MHVCLLTAVEAAPLGEAPLEAEVETLERVLQTAARRPHHPFSLHVSGTILHLLQAQRPDLGARLQLPQVEWVRAGWGRPHPTELPERVLRLSLEREAEAMAGLGLSGTLLWVRDGWNPRLPLLLDEAGIEALLLDLRPAPPSRSGVVTHLDRVLPAFRVEHRLGPPERSDDCLVVEVEPDRLEEAMDAVAASGGQDLTTPGRFGRDHPVSGRLVLAPPPPPSADPGREALVRALVRLTTRLPERVPQPVVDHLLAAGYAPALEPGASHRLRQAAHVSLITARAVLERGRGEDWGRVTRVDWDADGLEDVEIEQAELSLVLDPEASAGLLVLDDKADPWPALALPVPERAALWEHRSDGRRLDATFHLERSSEGKGEVTVTLATSNGQLQVSLSTTRRRLLLRYGFDRLGPGLVGPRIPLALGDVRLRVDGSAWRAVGDLAEVAGHRFRVRGDHREVLVSSMIPTRLSLRRVRGGVVLWPHSSTGGGSGYEVMLDLSA